MRIGESNELNVEFAIPRDNHMIIELVTEIIRFITINFSLRNF